MREPPPFVAHCLELLSTLGPAVRARRMFGGHGLFAGDLFVALIADDRLYLKADAATRAAFQRAGCTPFAYSRRERGAVTMSYWSAPDEAMDSPQGMQPWARLALASALRAQADKRAPAARNQAAAPRNPAQRKARTASSPRRARLRG